MTPVRIAEREANALSEPTLELLGDTRLRRQIPLLDDLDYMGAMLARDKRMLSTLDTVDCVQDVGVDVRFRDASMGLGDVWQPRRRGVGAIVQPLQLRGFHLTVRRSDGESRRMPREGLDLQRLDGPARTVDAHRSPLHQIAC